MKTLEEVQDELKARGICAKIFTDDEGTTLEWSHNGVRSNLFIPLDDPEEPLSLCSYYKNGKKIPYEDDVFANLDQFSKFLEGVDFSYPNV